MARQMTAAKPSPSAERPRQMNGAQTLVEALRREGVEVLFGHPGGASLPIYDALYDAQDIRHILVRHEQVAAHAAVGYARASGRVGVCTATSGPGATNLITGITDAMMDSAPIVAITGQVPRPVIGNDAFQEADVTGITMPITKYNTLVMRAMDIPKAVRMAFYLAKTGRPGPVLVDIPRDVSQELCEPDFDEDPVLPGYRPVVDGNPGQIAEAADALSAAERPIVYAGGGIISSGATPELTALVERTGIPVVLTLMGKGAMDETHPRCLGMFGMHGSAFANWAINRADVILAVGVRFDDRVTGRLKDFAPTPVSSTSTSTRPRSGRTNRRTFLSWATPSGCWPRSSRWCGRRRLRHGGNRLRSGGSVIRSATGSAMAVSAISMSAICSTV